MFPTRIGKQWYPTSGFKETALIYGAAQRSYRQTVKVFNHARRQENKDGTPLTTLRDVAQNEGLKVLNFLSSKARNVFGKFGFTEDGKMTAACSVVEKIPEKASFLKDAALQSALNTVCDDMKSKGLALEDIEKVQQSVINNQSYELPEQCVYVHLDKVGVKKQKPHRHSQNSEQEDAQVQPDNEKPGHPTVQNMVARIEHAGKGFTLTGRSAIEVLRFVLAFLLNNGLQALSIKVCTDGEKSLKDAVMTLLPWHPHLSFLLDWFHLVKKLKELLSMACKGREFRNAHLKNLLPLLWYGLVDEALAYLKTIPESELKNGEHIEKLGNYLQKHREAIPCYAIRSKLKLPNSSNPAERSNNQVTADRQKNHGMSWSKNGSHGLTALGAVIVNDVTQEWVKDRTMPFVLRQKAA